MPRKREGAQLIPDNYVKGDNRAGAEELPGDTLPGSLANLPLYFSSLKHLFWEQGDILPAMAPQSMDPFWGKFWPSMGDQPVGGLLSRARQTLPPEDTTC